MFFFFSILTKSAFIFTLFRLSDLLVGDFVNCFYSFNLFLIPLLLLTVLFGTLLVFNENTLQGFLMLASLPQLGYTLLGFLTPDSETRFISLVYFILYICSFILLYYVFFLLLGTYTYLNELSGLFYTNKGTSLIFLAVIGAFSGIPPFATFLGKFFLLNSLFITSSL